VQHFKFANLPNILIDYVLRILFLDIPIEHNFVVPLLIVLKCYAGAERPGVVLG